MRISFPGSLPTPMATWASSGSAMIDPEIPTIAPLWSGDIQLHKERPVIVAQPACRIGRNGTYIMPKVLMLTLPHPASHRARSAITSFIGGRFRLAALAAERIAAWPTFSRSPSIHYTKRTLLSRTITWSTRRSDRTTALITRLRDGRFAQTSPTNSRRIRLLSLAALAPERHHHCRQEPTR